jgi:hypothetical protein
MRTWLPLLLLSACADEAIEVRLEVPNATLGAVYSPACTTAVEVWLNGANYPVDEEDSARSCVSLEGKPHATWNELLASIRGQYSAAMPDSGLGGIEVYGFTGPCSAGSINDYDLTFYSHTKYEGGSTFVAPITPNLSCEPQDVKVRAVDLLKLLKTNQCAQAVWAGGGKLATTTLSPYPWNESTDWWGGQNGGTLAADGTATFRGLTKAGPQSCLAIANYTGKWEAISCAGPADQRACATGTELEAPMIPLAVAAASQDLAKTTKWRALVIGAVWNATPLAGAVVTIDAAYKDMGEIVYFDMPAGVETGVGALTPRAGTSTGPSGLFGVYTGSVVKINITQNGKTVQRTVGGYQYIFSQVALIKM